MKKNKITGLLYIVAALLFYICAVISYVNNKEIEPTHICFGSAFLLLGIVFVSKSK